MRIGVDEARKFFEHPSQQKGCMITPETLPEEGFEYWEKGGICGAFHRAPWPNVWMAHYGVIPSQWGKLSEPAKDVLMEFWAHHNPDLIMAMTAKTNRAAVSFAKRIGFKVVGSLSAESGDVVITEWKPWPLAQQSEVR